MDLSTHLSHSEEYHQGVRFKNTALAAVPPRCRRSTLQQQGVRAARLALVHGLLALLNHKASSAPCSKSRAAGQDYSEQSSARKKKKKKNEMKKYKNCCPRVVHCVGGPRYKDWKLQSVVSQGHNARRRVCPPPARTRGSGGRPDHRLRPGGRDTQTETERGREGTCGGAETTRGPGRDREQGRL